MSESNPTGGGFSVGHFIGKLFSGDGGGMVGGVSPMGDFDPVQFVNANLSAAQHSKGGVGLKDILQGVAGLLGVGKGHQAGAPQPSPDDSAPVTQGTKAPKLNPTHLKHANDLLDNILTTLGNDPNQGNQ